MLFVDNLDNNDPAVNLALEEYVLRNDEFNGDLLLFYINSPSIIIGRHQNTIEEINKDYVEEHGINVVRRLSGGGAVYHDLGNLNFSFITGYQPGHFANFRLFTEPVLRALLKLGVDAELSGRNDILVDGKKVSGNAQYISHGRIVSHGTLLFNSDLTHVSEALHVKESKIISKGIKSVRSRVTNILDYLPRPITIEEFRQKILLTYFDGVGEIQKANLTAEDWRKVNALADERYRSWEWTYGYSPAFNIEKHEKFPWGEIEARLDVSKGVIQCIKFYGDYFSEVDTSELEQLLVGVQYESSRIEQALKDVQIDRYFSGMDLETFRNFLC